MINPGRGLANFADFFAFVDFQSIFQWKYPGGIIWKLLHTKKPAFYKGMIFATENSEISKVYDNH